MRKKAILYIRVSTDEQAERGYSLGVQKDQLERYCEAHQIDVLVLFREDHSAKNFHRPEFNKFLAYAKKHHRDIDYFLFVSWDRFSRNAPDAYNMIRKLKTWSIEPQAITQPIDFSVPQSKIMLSIYLTLPEVDNDIRSEKVKMGMRGANKLGRWTSTAPIGYKNRRDDENKPIIVPKEHERDAIRWAFLEVAKNERLLSDIRLELNNKGVRVSRSAFSTLLRNPVYGGKIRIRSYNDEPEYFAEGLHEGIVEHDVFDQVQYVLTGRVKKLNKRSSFRDHDELPLRGLLSCGKCKKHITGSASKSRNGSKHYYYHCMNCHSERYRADTANLEMEKLLSAMQIPEETQELYDTIVLSEMNGSNQERAQQKSTLQQELNKLMDRKTQLQNMLLDGKLEAEDYKELKQRIDNRIFEVRSLIDDMKQDRTALTDELKKIIRVLPNIAEWYRNSSVQDKKQLIGSIFPEKFTFEKNRVRTTSLNDVVALILKYTGRFDENKKGTKGYFNHLSLLVSPSGFEPETASLEGRCSIQLSYEPKIVVQIAQKKRG